MALDAEPRAGSAPLTKPSTALDTQQQRLLYLLSRYPAISHTFFLNEIRELRKRGFAVEVASINQPDRSRSSMPVAEVEEAEKTFYIKSAGVVRAAAVVAKTLLLRPKVITRGLTAALRLGRWDARATLYAFFYLSEALILGDWMRSRDHHHLHIHFCGPVATVGMLASIAWGFSYSLTVHGPDEFYDVEKFYLGQKIAHARFIVCISQFCRSQLMRIAAPEHWNKIYVAHLGVDLDVFSPVCAHPGPDHLLEILCVGRLVPSKGQMILLRACAILHAKGCPVQVRLVGDGPDRKHLLAFAEREKIPVLFEGAKTHDETRRLLGQADIFALASFAEGVPVALMEAMAMEVPCVTTAIAGIPELIRDGLDGLLVPASSAEMLAAALERLVEDPHLRRSIGLAGRKRVRDLYNLPENMTLLTSLFRENLPNNT